MPKAIWTSAALKKAEKRAASGRGPSNKPPRIYEADIQSQIIQSFAWKYQKIYATGALFAVPNGGKRGRTAQAQVKKEGIISGASDLILLWPSNGYHGACLEVKAPDGTISENQAQWLEYRRQSGYYADVVWNSDEGIKFFDLYLSEH